MVRTPELHNASLTRISLGLAAVCVFLACSPSFSAIGIYDWQFTPNGADPPVTVEYRLNCPGTVTIEILDESEQVVCTLGPFEETAGLHQHDWDGTGAAPGTSPYHARIAATNDGIGSAGELQKLFGYQSLPDIYGVAVDKYAASPGYGTIYESEVCAGGRVRAYYADGSPKYGFGGNPADNAAELGFASWIADAPWGIGVDRLGNIYAARKTAPGIGVGVKILDYLGNELHEVSADVQTGNFWLDGVATQTDLEVYQTVGTDVRSAKVSNGVWSTAMVPGIAGTQTRQLCFEPGGLACYVATQTTSGAPANVGVRRYARTDSSQPWVEDTSFASRLEEYEGAVYSAADVAIGVSCDARDPDGPGPCSSSCLWIALGATGPYGGYVVRRILPDTVPPEDAIQFFAGPGVRGRIVAADAVGNVAMEYGTQGPDSLWLAWGLFVPGGESSTDVRTTDPAMVTGSGSPEPVDTICGLRARPDNSLVELAAGKVVAAVFADCFYIEESDHCCGIRADGSASVSVGDVVRVRGRLGTVNGERTLEDAEIVAP